MEALVALLRYVFGDIVFGRGLRLSQADALGGAKWTVIRFSRGWPLG